jgi:SAM-dependent methyltransferase
MQTHLKENAQFEFKAVEKFCTGMGLDFGCGTNRFSPTVLSIDYYPHKDADIVWQILDRQLPFVDNVFDFVFSSHVIEDFHPDKIQYVYDELLRIVKPGGYFCILGPAMDGVRYPLWDELFTSEDAEVVAGNRRVGELKGNPSHLVNWDLELCHKIKANSKYPSEVVQENTLPDNQMTIDFVIKKL